MDERRINEAVTYVREAAAAVERAAVEILSNFREGRFDPAPVGFPAYVRGLRDRAAVDRYNRDPNCSEAQAILEANAIVKALGYEPPGED